MLLVAITGPDEGAPIWPPLTRVAELAREFKEVVEANAVAPESWLARGALVTLMVLNQAVQSTDAGQMKGMFFRRRGVSAI